MDSKTQPIERPPVTLLGLCEAANSLQVKATALVLAVTLCVTASVSGYLLHAATGRVREQHHRSCVQLAKTLALTAGEGLAEEDTTALAELGRRFVDGSPVLFVAFFDRDLQLISATEHRSLGQLPPPRAASHSLGTPRYWRCTGAGATCLEIMYPVSSRPADTGAADAGPPAHLVGYLQLGVAAPDYERSLSATVDTLVGVGIIALGLGIPLAFFLIRRIVSPLAELRDLMDAFSAGQLQVRATPRRADEIGQIQAAFNRMADQHERNHNRVLRLNSELEERVARRTHQLRELAARDPLTGLYNRRHFNEMLEQQLAEAQRYGTDLSCLMIDLDNFKAVNDSQGHQRGDHLLIVAAQTIRDQLRGSDVAARFGGDEFVVLLPQTDGDRARVLGERVMAQFATESSRDNVGALATLSVGIASYQQLEQRDAGALIRAADRALYRAKSAGRNRLVVADPTFSAPTTAS